MSDYSDQVAAIAARLNTVTDIGQVHARTRFSADWSTYLDHMKATVSGASTIRGWMIAPTEVSSSPGAFAANDREYQWDVFGIQSFSDSTNTEAAFYALVELVMDALDFRKDLGVGTVIDFSVGPTSARFEHRMFGSVLCHAVTLTVRATTRKSGTYA